MQPGKHAYYWWDGKKFLPFSLGEAVDELQIAWLPVLEAPFELPYEEELQIGEERTVTWKKFAVEGKYGFITIEKDYNVAQIYADGKLVADHYYYGRPWRVPTELLAGKECYLVMSERKDDFYRKF